MSDGLKVFIVGSARSGTSITYFAMREVFGLVGRGESHVFPIFQRIVHMFFEYRQKFENVQGVLAGELNVRIFKDYLFVYIRDLYSKAYKSDSFVDKTPGAEAIRGCGLILGAFPDARIIMTRRNGIEVVKSFQSKFGTSFEDACRAWSQCALASAQIRDAHPDILEIDQYDLTNAPEETALKIAEHLDRPEKAKELAMFFATRRVEKLSDHDWRRRLTLADVDWPEEAKETFRRICGEQMHELGYAL
jgi:hypothetical protein